MITPPSIYEYAKKITKKCRGLSDQIDMLLDVILEQESIINEQAEEIEALTPKQFFTDVDK